ncbi:hypothetical protein PBY51_004292 [Eleginops maclovinus]|uniref:Dynein regulatory complex protein 10 n=1 Tax=Eleginops maclovinus TaxID=56733 RepID=A0AAN8AT84_ELEMC|nr:hypothetical protein PBY51_004292 [Eleginops maclovinus]
MSAKRSTVLGKTQLEDAPANHELPQRKALSLEAQRISNILKNCISGVEFVAILPSLLQLNSLSSVVDKELSIALHEHQLLEKRLETLECLKQGSDREQGSKAMARLEKDTKNSLRDLFRLAKAHPEAIAGLKAELGMKPALGESEYNLITELKKFQRRVVEKLLTTVDEELRHQLVLIKTSCNTHHLKSLASSQESQATSIQQLDANISTMNERVQYQQRYLKDINTYISLHLTKKSQAHTAALRMKISSKPQGIDQLNSLLNKLMFENRQAERVIQEKNEKVETEIENLLHHFDTEMEEKQAKLELNRMDYEREEEELKMLEKLFSVLEVECTQIQEKRRLAEEKRREEVKDLELKTKAAIIAQAWWRGYSTRKALKNKGKSKKAKKGKGKKTK